MMAGEKKSVLIVTFSPGGGCSELADVSTVILSRLGHEVDCLDITYPADREAACGLELHADILLCIFPVYIRNLPLPVVQFLSRAELFVGRAAMILGYGSCGVKDAAIRARAQLAASEISLSRVMSCPLLHSFAFMMDEKQILPDSLAEVGRFILSVVEDEYDEDSPIQSEGFDLLGKLPLGLLTKLVASVPTTVESECTFCGKCAKVCPTGAITLDKFAIDSARCIRCAACVKNCPSGAKSIKLYPWTRAMLRRGFKNTAEPVELTVPFESGEEDDGESFEE